MTLLGKANCANSRHDWVPVRWLTCNRFDEGYVCRRCYANREAMTRPTYTVDPRQPLYLFESPSRGAVTVVEAIRRAAKEGEK